MPTPLQEKAQENLDSARFLIGKGCHDSSIHCAYYACLQTIKQILYIEMGEIQLENALGSGNSSTHWYLINEICQRYSRKTGLRYKPIKNSLNKIKQSRKEADYQTKRFLSQESNSILKDAIDLIKLLQSTF